MAKTVLLKAQKRNGIGRTAVKSLRAGGRVPAVIYGKRQSEALSLDSKELLDVLHHSTSENVLVDLEVISDSKTEKRLALIQDVQHHPLKDYIVHIDLHEIAQDEKLHTEVPVQEVGEPVGVKTGGGLLEAALRHLRVECLPKDLPEIITVDVSHLNVGQAVHVGEIALPAGVTVLNHKDLPVFIVHAPAVEEEVKPGTAEITQPEVIKEKKTEEAAAADAKGGKAEGKK